MQGCLGKAGALLRLGVLAAAVAFLAPARAQDYPARPVRLIAPYAPGGVTDLLAREIGTALSQQMGMTFVVENRPGGGGTIGLAALAKAPADGYTLGEGAANTLAANRFLYKDQPFDALRDFTPVAFIGRLPFVLVAHPSVPAGNLTELIERMHAAHASYSYGSSGVGNTAHIFGELLAHRAGINLVHVPYKSSGEALRDLMAGRLELQFITPVELAGPIAEGRVKALAVAAPRRLATLPGVPTLAELGFEGFESPTWFGIVAPAGVPAPIILQLNHQIRTALAKPDIRERLARRGLETVDMSPEAFRRFLEAEVRKWQSIVRESGVVLD
jgi:tripartite-type tricarboxylate transporter receptor subunit TctC